MAKITKQLLKKKKACAVQYRRFVDITGGEVEITENWCLYYAGKFDWDWAAENLLSLPALAEYERVLAQAWDEYDSLTAPARAEYKSVIVPALAKYKRVTAQAFARAFNGQDK